MLIKWLIESLGIRRVTKQNRKIVTENQIVKRVEKRKSQGRVSKPPSRKFKCKNRKSVLNLATETAEPKTPTPPRR